MGSGESKDENVDIYMELDRPYYQAGTELNGNVYINAKTNINYGALYVAKTLTMLWLN